MSVRSIWFMVLFNFSVSFLIFYLFCPLFKVVLKSLTVIVELSISPLNSVSFASCVLGFCY